MEKAATKIQAGFKGMKARQQVKEKREEAGKQEEPLKQTEVSAAATTSASVLIYHLHQHSRSDDVYSSIFPSL